MSHRLTRAAACLLGLAVATSGANAATTASLAASSAAVRVAALAPRPKSKAPRPSSVASRLRNRKPLTRRGRLAAAPATDAARAAVAAIPPIVQLPIAELVLQGGPTPSEAFAALPIVPAPVAGMDGRPLGGFGASAERLLESMMTRARSQLGTRYVLGGNVPGLGLDCSSFARFAMEALGITLPRTAAQQARVGDAVPRDRAQLRPGDLLTFGTRKKVSHVGIYLGEGRFIHASVTSGRIIETTIERNTRLFRQWLGARRLVAAGDSSGARRDG